MKDLLTIREFAELSGVEYSTLRYWDDIGLFSPIMRDPENNYRYYKSAQLVTLNFITTLSDIQVQLKTIGELKNNRDPQKFIKLIDSQEKMLNEELRKLRIAYAIIHARRELVSYGLNVDETQISVMRREERKINLGPPNEYAKGDTFVDALAPLVRQSRDLHINLSFPLGGYFDNLQSFIDNPMRPDRFFSIDPAGSRERTEGEYLVGFSRGYYGEFGDLPQRMAAYAEENSIDIYGPLYVIYLHDEVCVQNPDQYLAQCCIAVREQIK